MRALLILIFLWFATATSAHEVKPALLELREIPNNEGIVTYQATLRIPRLRGKTLSLTPHLPADCESRILSQTPEVDFVTTRADVTCAQPLAGRALTIDGLSATQTDALVRLVSKRGQQTLRATPDAPTLALPEAPTRLGTLASYFRLGLIHIFEGPDHLAFVLGLLLLVSGARRLVEAITAFTVAHSITLALSALGFAGLPSAPVEAVIALSIVFLAYEVVRGDPDSLSRRKPWLAAFAFGMLHGFGFAGALTDIGLPQGDVPLALLAFNLGIEAGQLLFVAAAGSVLFVLSKIDWRRPAELFAAYGLGGLATAWTIARLASL